MDSRCQQQHVSGRTCFAAYKRAISSPPVMHFSVLGFEHVDLPQPHSLSQVTTISGANDMSNRRAVPQLPGAEPQRRARLPCSGC